MFIQSVLHVILFKFNASVNDCMHTPRCPGKTPNGNTDVFEAYPHTKSPIKSSYFLHVGYYAGIMESALGIAFVFFMQAGLALIAIVAVGFCMCSNLFLQARDLPLLNDGSLLTQNGDFVSKEKRPGYRRLRHRISGQETEQRAVAREDPKKVFTTALKKRTLIGSVILTRILDRA